MKRTSLNFAVDLIAFLAFVVLASTGVLLHYVLPAGSGHFLSVRGWDRHDWGGLHFWSAAFFMATLGLHLVLHWKWILAVVQGRGSDDRQAAWKVSIAAVCLVLLLALIAAPLFLPVERSDFERPGRGRMGGAVPHESQSHREQRPGRGRNDGTGPRRFDASTLAPSATESEVLRSSL